MRKKIKLFAISSWFTPGEKKLNIFIQFFLNYKILNQNAIFLYNRHSVNLQIDEIDKILSQLSFFWSVLSRDWVARHQRVISYGFLAFYHFLKNYSINFVHSFSYQLKIKTNLISKIFWKITRTFANPAYFFFRTPYNWK